MLVKVKSSVKPKSTGPPDNSRNIDRNDPKSDESANTSPNPLAPSRAQPRNIPSKRLMKAFGFVKVNSDVKRLPPQVGRSTSIPNTFNKPSTTAGVKVSRNSTQRLPSRNRSSNTSVSPSAVQVTSITASPAGTGSGGHTASQNPELSASIHASLSTGHSTSCAQILKEYLIRWRLGSQPSFLPR